jgi:hypothetical protein
MLPLFREDAGEQDDCCRSAKEKLMIPTNKIAINKPLLAGAVLLFSLSAAVAGPCNTADKDAGSGKVPGYTGQTTGQAAAPSETAHQPPAMTKSAEADHPPTARMNKATEGTATSSQDTQRQMQGQPTAAEQGERDKKTAAADKGC